MVCPFAGERIAYDDLPCRANFGAGAPMSFEGTGLAGYSPRELLLAAAARAVLAAFREPRARQRLPAPAAATLQILETSLEPYETSK